MTVSDSTVVVMDQFAVTRQAAGAVGARTALAHAGLPVRGSKSSVSDIVGSRVAASKTLPTVELEEAVLTGFLSLRAGSARNELAAALKNVMSLELPECLQSHVATEGSCIRWMSPDEWLLSCPIDQCFSIEQTLRVAIKGPVAIVNVSGGYCRLTLSGENAFSVLAKSTSYNINPENFPEGKVVNTVMAKAQVTLRAVDVDCYEILVRRSFADYLWLWLQRAGGEFGLRGIAAAD